ncbi:hypothetical protein HETIRDRAFT_315317 [Heterobasidion irregulare TC 32-1]|uniref:CCHC-type domain-containing protein n=1 Tax=Heterobasidion irregulare (strain TC 32-1) TaxID=747525 RepID=W4KC74_HETIT|nr:uncharacterized protein HETIRDRAFT_315317 [Heterobasidion irregulare TC 32-1]ETW83368.1 hypothetical protein HETIRDRAFT_315317 [Heterobasidion irregulare TC 32-1]
MMLEPTLHHRPYSLKQEGKESIKERLSRPKTLPNFPTKPFLYFDMSSSTLFPLLNGTHHLSPLALPVPEPFSHLPMTDIHNALPYPYADPFPGNRLPPIPDFDDTGRPISRPGSPPYNPEQAAQEHEAHRSLDASSPRTGSPSDWINHVREVERTGAAAHSPSPPASDWQNGARASERVWPPLLDPSPSPPPLVLPPPATDTRLCWECDRPGHLIANCPITRIRHRSDITARNFIRDYDAYGEIVELLSTQLAHVAENYGYYWHVRNRMIDDANWEGHPTRHAPVMDPDHFMTLPLLDHDNVTSQRRV